MNFKNALLPSGSRKLAGKGGGEPIGMLFTHGRNMIGLKKGQYTADTLRNINTTHRIIKLFNFVVIWDSNK